MFTASKPLTPGPLTHRHAESSLVSVKAKRATSFGGLDYFKPEYEGEVTRLGTNENGISAFRAMRPDLARNPFTLDKDIIDNQVAIVEFGNGVRTTFHFQSVRRLGAGAAA